jgi:hypothetical protein
LKRQVVADILHITTLQVNRYQEQARKTEGSWL